MMAKGLIEKASDICEHFSHGSSFAMSATNQMNHESCDLNSTRSRDAENEESYDGFPFPGQP